MIWPELDTLMRLDRMEPGEIAAYTGGLVSRLVFTIIAVLVPMAAADLIFQKRRHLKSLKMSKQDVKDEARQSDVAPEIKAAIKRRARELGRQRMLGDVPTADVVVTNPTHYAVALRYGQGRVGAAGRRQGRRPDRAAHPRARGRARRSRSSRTRRSPARCTARSRSARRSPAEFFGAVAEVLAFVFRTSRRSLSWA